MGGKRKSSEDLIVLAVLALLVWVASRVKGSFRVIVTTLLLASAILALTTTKAWMAGFVVIGVVFMWREKLPRGLYLRRAVSIGPVRVNVSTSGLGGSVGVRGARVGRRPDGSKYVHVGSGGTYYRKELPMEPKPKEPAEIVTEIRVPVIPPEPEVARSIALAADEPEIDGFCLRCDRTFAPQQLVEVRQCLECRLQGFDGMINGQRCPNCGSTSTRRLTERGCPDCLEPVLGDVAETSFQG